MEKSSRHVNFRRFAGLGVMVALLATAFAPAVAASQGPPAASPPSSTRSIEKIFASEKIMAPKIPDSVRMSWTAADPAKTTPKQAKSSGSFFKTRTGQLVLVAMAVGTGYALYSAKEDRIRGSIR